MSTVVLAARADLRVSAQRMLATAARFWLIAAVIGQWAFLYYIAVFYGPSSLTGNFAAWSKNTSLIRGYVAGDTAGNLAFAAHALMAAVTSFGGALQLVPQLREKAMALHRWNGKLFFVTAIGVSATGLYMVWVRGSRLDLASAIAVSLNGLLIIVTSSASWRLATLREVALHRRWALRAYLLANAQWFFRVGLFTWILLNRGPVGINHDGTGPFMDAWAFGCWLLPLAVLELYLNARTSRSRYAVAGLLVVLTLLMSAGIFGVVMFMWRPTLGRM